MPKKICCCTDEKGRVKQYIAIPCLEYNSNIYSEIKTQRLFRLFDTGLNYVNPGPTSPFKIIGFSQTNRYRMDIDLAREVLVMMRGAGGGSRPLSYGGNGAYIQFEVVPREPVPYGIMGVMLQPGGTGPDPGNYDVHTTIPNLGGGPGYPLSGWGGGAAGFALVNSQLQNGGSRIVAGGGGAGGIIGSIGGHGGTSQGITGTGFFPGHAAEQTQGGDAGDSTALAGSFLQGGRGKGNWGNPLSPNEDTGGGGGSGLFGGGGGGSRSSGGGGASSLADFYTGESINSEYLFDGTDIGPGNRCLPFFTLNMDPGLGSHREGRYISGITFETGFSGAPSQAAEYHRTKWCPCFETQIDFSNDTTGPLPEKTHICLTPEQYQTIITNLPDVPPPPDLVGIRVAFELNGEKYILVQEDPETTDPSTGHYSCNLGCEPIFNEDGIPTNVRWYIPSRNFDCFDDTFDWFALNFETYDFTNVTSCCDCFLCKPICTAPFTSCLGSIDEFGNPTGCLCPTIPPKPVASCRTSDDDPSVAYLSNDETSGWLYLCVPGICWTFFGTASVVTKFECNPDSEVIEYRNMPNNVGVVDTTDEETLVAEYCSQETNEAFCADTGGVNCEITLNREHPYCDYHAIKCPITVASQTKLCTRTLYGALACNPCPSSEIVDLDVDTEVSFRCNTRACDGDCDQWSPPNVQPCSSGSVGGDERILDTIITLPQQFSFLKKLADQTAKVIGSATTVVKNVVSTFIYDETTKEVELRNTDIYSQLIQPPGGPGGGQGGNQNETGGGQGGSSPENCPCEDDVSPTASCGIFAADIGFTGFKFEINRLDCPPTEYLQALLCGECDDQVREQGYDIIKQSWFKEVDETTSYTSTTCLAMNFKSVQDIKEKVLSIRFPACLFDEFSNPEQKIEKAMTLCSVTPEVIDLESSSAQEVQVGINGEVVIKKVQTLIVCDLRILLFSCNAEDIANKINQCLGTLNGQISASAGDPYYWFNYRLMSCPNNPRPGTGDVKTSIKTGDRLFKNPVGQFNVDGSVTIYFDALSFEGVDGCALVKTDPVGFRGENPGIGTINICKSINIVSAAQWARGTRFVMMQYEQLQATETVSPGNCDIANPNVILRPSLSGLAGPPCFDNIQSIKSNYHYPVVLGCWPVGQGCLNDNFEVIAPCPPDIASVCECERYDCNYPMACVIRNVCTTSASPITVS